MNERKLNWLLTGSFTFFFVALRCFTDTPYYFVGYGDEASFFRLAENFPTHKLYADALYLIHPPLYFYALRMFNVTGDYHVAGLLLSLASAISVWIVAISLLQMLVQNRLGIAIGLLYLTAINLSISQMGSVSREPFIMALFSCTLIFYIRWLRESSRSLWPAVLFSVAAAWTTDLVVLLIACLIVCSIFFGTRPKWKAASGLLITVSLAYSAWLGVRAFMYMNHDFYPAGIDGTFEDTRNFGLLAVFNPNFLPETYRNVSVSLSQSGLRLSGLPALYINPFWNPQALLLALMLFCAAAGNILAWRRHGWKNTSLCFLILSLVLLSPLFLGQWPRYGLPAVLTIAVLLGSAVSEMTQTVTSSRLWRFIPHLFAGTTLLMGAIWILGHPILTFKTQMRIEGKAVADALNQQHGEPVMAPAGLSPEIAYLTKKETVAMPSVPQQLEMFLRKYGVQYIVFAKFSTAGMPLELQQARGVATIEKIMNTPQEFAHLADVHEQATISFNWQQRTAWNPTRVTAQETTRYRLIHDYSIYRVLKPAEIKDAESLRNRR